MTDNGDKLLPAESITVEFDVDVREEAGCLACFY
jgi:hypothetical protein